MYKLCVKLGLFRCVVFMSKLYLEGIFCVYTTLQMNPDVLTL